MSLNHFGRFPSKCSRPSHTVYYGHGMEKKVDPNSFVQTEMRRASMKLHTRDQSKEGEQKPSKPIPQWEMSPTAVLKFLVDTKLIHTTLDEIAGKAPELKEIYQASDGIRRIDGIERDIKNLMQNYPELELPEPGADALGYSQQLLTLAEESIPGFVCHYYNTHFANAAGGRMIGKFISDKISNGETLNLYKYDDGKKQLEDVRKTIDELANTWDKEDRSRCVEETPNAFKGASTVLQNLR
eukprot:CAMPEP_0167749402 /NCGR_PEP_ID=MMETSP0110_2-20121227/5387_1 /TAXON_ID=629695 /ORGANISM="Gymnochlora sp., Strain CCMP2014" /LENGTH=240 /DNA_ID=CAMNT_0007634551 /DNA_START=128 /DNA_END=850 /DNA_ORIENTATION=+